jgi:hypothetical protein
MGDMPVRDGRGIAGWQSSSDVNPTSRHAGCQNFAVLHLPPMPMRFVFLLLAALVGGRLAAADDEVGLRASKPEVRKQIVATIDLQLAAFRRHDLGRAYSYSAADLRAQKPLEVFVAIVRNNYPEIWTNTRAEYGIVRDDGETATVLVHVFAKDSDASYDYELVRERGGWRVHGVLRHDPQKEEKV